MNKTCKQCQHFLAFDNNKGYCRAGNPISGEDPAKPVFPIVAENSWCGMWRNRNVVYNGV